MAKFGLYAKAIADAIWSVYFKNKLCPSVIPNDVSPSLCLVIGCGTMLSPGSEGEKYRLLEHV